MNRFFLTAALCNVLAASTLCIAQSGASAHQPLRRSGQSPLPGGVNTGGTHSAVYDEQHRPNRPAASAQDRSPCRLSNDISAESGLAQWSPTPMGSPEKRFILEAGRRIGVGLIDYDNKRLARCLSRQRLKSGRCSCRQSSCAGTAASLANNHDGTFTNVAEKAGVANERWGFRRRLPADATITTAGPISMSRSSPCRPG